MTIAICGASGLVGAKLFDELQASKSRVIVVGRDAARLQSRFPNANECLNWETFANLDPNNLDAIVNLSGAGVMDRKWTDAYKKIMSASRIDSTRSCAGLVTKNPDIRFINASAVHAYGIYADDHKAFVEGDLPRGDGVQCYLHKLITEWEKALQPAIDAGASVAMLRLGVVLAKGGGSLGGMLPIFRSFLGGRQGTGRQIMSWISLDDVVAGIIFLLNNPHIRGPVNFVSPEASTNAEVMQSLGKAISRPSLLPMPSFLARLLLGEAADELVLAGQRVKPRVLLEGGFEFIDSDIDSCLNRLLNSNSS